MSLQPTSFTPRPPAKIQAQINLAGSFGELANIHRQIPEVARTQAIAPENMAKAMEAISATHHAIIRKAFELSLAEMHCRGLTRPPVRFCFLIMGSGGRGEMLLSPDQDSGLIFEDYPDSRQPEVDSFFTPFSELLVEALAAIGYPPCPGQAMISNPAWRGRLRDWRQRLGAWINDPQPLKIRHTSIFLDFLPLAGDAELATQLRQLAREQLRSYESFLYHMMSLDVQYRVPLSLLRRFRVEKKGSYAGKLSLKQGGTVYIVDCVRMFALEKEVEELNTFKRLVALERRQVLGAETVAQLSGAFALLNFLRLRNEVRLADAGQPPSHYLDPHDLGDDEQEALRDALQAVKKLQESSKRHFSRTPF